jgi:hypothetical protein
MAELTPETTAATEYLARLRDLLATATQTLPLVTFNKHNPQHFVMVCLYGTILQSGSDCYRLMQEPTVTVAGVLRSILESYADLCALARDPDHAKKMLATFRDEQRKHLEDMIRSQDNPFHADVARQLDAEGKLEEILGDLRSLQESGHLPLSVYDRFVRADLADLYRTLYWQLCLQAHNNIIALERRHVRHTGDADFEIDVFSENDDDEIRAYCDSLGGILVQGTRKFFETVRFQLPENFAQTIDAFERIRPKH